jgi:hypothetical protein
MMFDDLWRAERRERKRAKELRDEYYPLLDAAKKAKDSARYQEVLGEFHACMDLNDEGTRMRTELLVHRARRLGIPVPPRPVADSDEVFENESWEVNTTTWNFYLKDEAELKLRREIRKEEVERLQHQMRWVSQVIIPLIGLIGALMGLISLLHSLRH